MKWDGYKNELIMILPLKFGHTVTPMKHFSTLEEEKEVEYEFTFLFFFGNGTLNSILTHFRLSSVRFILLS